MTQEAPPALIQQARATLLSAAEQHQLQGQADAVCAQTRLVAEELLQENGTLKRDFGVRFLHGMFTAVVVTALLVAAMEVYSLRKYGTHSWEDFDQLEWKTSVNGSEPLIAVYLKTNGGGKDARRAPTISAKVQGLNQSLDLYKSYGQIMEPFPRRPNLEEAQRWDQLVRALRNPQATP